MCAATLLVVACAGRTPEPAAEGPLLWRARSEGGGVLYLLGSIHVGEGAPPALGPAVERAWQASEELVVEVDVGALAPEELTALLMRHGTLRPPARLASVLSPDIYAEVIRYFEQRGTNPLALESLQPWVVATMVAAEQLEFAGYDAEHGVDRTFLDAAGPEKPVVSLETAQSQFAMMSGLSLELQEQMLRDTLLRADVFHDHTGELMDAWARGDEKALARILFAPLEEHPELEDFYDAVFFRRNEQMSERLAVLARDGGTRFAVIGAGHMLGPRGIPSLLGERGFDVDRISGGP